MKKTRLLFFVSIIHFSALYAQLTTPPDGGNKKASVSERIGITDVTIRYDRPAVKGREGKIWGELVPYGLADQGFGTSKAAPWRAGANESTTIEFSTDVMVEGKPVPAGRYALFMTMQPDNATVILNKNDGSWGSFFYDPKEDILQARVPTHQLQNSVERLKYEFSGQTENGAVINLMWEKLAIPFKVEVDLVKTQLASFRKELTGEKGFRPEPWVQASQFCVQNNTNLDEALQWADYAISGPFIGKKSFQTLSNKAMVLNAMNRNQEGEALMQEALTFANMNELHQYGRQLLNKGKNTEALAVFQENAKKNPNVFTTNVGLARGYSAVGDYKKALKYARAALPQAPDKLNQNSLQEMISKLEKGTDIN